MIAEIGVNHNRSMEQAFELIAAAKNAGADVAKFQAAEPKEVVSVHAPKADYQRNFGAPGESQLEMTRRIHLDLDALWLLKEECYRQGMRMLVSGFGPTSNGLIEELNLGWWKIPSGEINNLPYLRQIGARSEEILLSTGLSTLSEVHQAVSALEEAGTPRDLITVLQCTTAYPAPIKEANLRAMVSMGKALKVKIGYSDHTTSISTSIAAVALGASVIEKHLTLDKNAEGPDHLASTEPDQFGMMVAGIREAELALGSEEKVPTPSELANLQSVRRSIVANRKILRGEFFSPENVSTKRPSGGLDPMNWDRVIGRRAEDDFEEDQPIHL